MEPAGEIGVLALALGVAWVSDRHPLLLPLVEPWDFSWPAFLAVGFGLLWFFRGLRCSDAGEHLPVWRRGCFVAGVAVIYAMLLTHFEYVAQHMFFLNRVQHLVMHHLGPFLIALSWPGEVIAAGMPGPFHRLCHWAPLCRALRVVQQPALAFLLFEGLLILWLIPPVTFRAMLDSGLYAIMNASMVIDGLLFWFLVLDPRDPPVAPVSFFTRLTLAFLIIFPQIAVGTVIGAARYDLYPSFTLCGRVFPGIDALTDQQIGGLVLWVPAGMMSAIAAVLIARRMFLHDDWVAGMPPVLPGSERGVS
jgi:putative membrane protein